MPNLNDLCRDAFETAKSKGFWEGHRAFGELLMLVVSEASEALEDYRLYCRTCRATAPCEELQVIAEKLGIEEGERRG
jgi:hypothetical protein